MTTEPHPSRLRARRRLAVLVSTCAFASLFAVTAGDPSDASARPRAAAATTAAEVVSEPTDPDGDTTASAIPADPADPADLATSDDTVRGRLDDLDRREVEARRALRAAEHAEATARRDLAVAEQEERDAVAAAAVVEAEVKAMAVDAFTESDDDPIFGSLGAANADEVSHGQTFLQSRADDRAEVLRRFREATERARRATETVHGQLAAADATVAEQRRVLERIDAAKADRAAMATALDDRVESALAEADSLGRVDARAAWRLVANQRDLRRRASEPAPDVTPTTAKPGRANAPRSTTTRPTTTRPTTTVRPSTTIRPTTTKRATPTTRATTTTRPAATTPPATPTTRAVAPPPPVDLTNVNGLSVATSMAANLRSLMVAASAAGFRLGGSGYRNPTSQINLRIAHCGPTPYDIYERPASQCSPPTARPGLSMHERGLAADLTCNGALISTRADPCWVWLSQNAGRFGLYNLPSEPWHWSINGS